MYRFTEDAAANLREKDDVTNSSIAGFFGGATLGLSSTCPRMLPCSIGYSVPWPHLTHHYPGGRIPRILGIGAGMSIILTAVEYTGGSLRGKPTDPSIDEYERKELMRKNRVRPLEETLVNIGEGRGMSIAFPIHLPQYNP
jgi:hypothetical protein